MNTVKSILTAGVLAFLVTLSVAPVSANGVDEVLNNMRAAGKNIKSLRASLTQEKKDNSIGGPAEKYYGTIVMQRGERQGSEKVKIKYSNGQELSVIGEKITLYQPSINPGDPYDQTENW
jgi:outer membrane lipoprotein-sorting protein